MLLKYILQGIAVSIGYYFLSNKKTSTKDLVIIFGISATLFLLIEHFMSNNINEGFVNSKLDRNSGNIYSGDIINIYNEDKSKVLQRSPISSEIQFKKPIANVGLLLEMPKKKLILDRLVLFSKIVLCIML